MLIVAISKRTEHSTISVTKSSKSMQLISAEDCCPGAPPIEVEGHKCCQSYKTVFDCYVTFSVLAALDAGDTI